jgi:NAD(P)-dependent dehydrogenase (short-subunit alcohol dehydrogenase family)
VPMGRIGDPREVGRMAVYLCSDDAAYVTGGCFTIDGGLTSIPAG